MAFIDSTSDQRVELLRQAEKTANLTRRVTVGSGVLGAPEGAEGDALCTSLSSALSDIGYGSTLGPTDAVVTDAQPIQINGYNGSLVTNNGTVAVVADSGTATIKLPSGIVGVGNGNTIRVGTTSNTTPDIHDANVTIVDGVITRTTLASTATAFLDNNDTVNLQNSQGTAVGNAATALVSGGVITAMRAPSSTALVVASTRPTIQNSAGTVTVTGSVPTITNGAIANIKLPATHAVVTAGSYTTIPVTGAFTTTVAFTVADGAITGITLS